MLEKLKEKVFKANLDLVKHNLVIFTWGNVSAITEDRKYVVIKPSGVDYETMKAEDMVVLTLEGEKVEGDLKPSSDTPTHLEIYRKFQKINAIVHTHSTYATIYAQSGKDLLAYGTTQSDYFNGNIPCTRKMSMEEVKTDYELNTGKVIVRTFKEKNIKPEYCPSVLVNEHGPFSWGKDAFDAVHNAVVLEQVCKMGVYTSFMKEVNEPLQEHVLNKHFYRKHGENAYYGQ